MIVPVTPETEWLPSLKVMPVWAPPARPVLLISPHPDDETLGAGGFIFDMREAGTPVKVVAVTDGENAYADSAGLGETRVLEQTEALEILKVAPDQIVRAQLSDSSVSSKVDSLIEILLPLCSKDTHIIAPWTGDFHPDHEACGRAATEVARQTGAALTFYIFWTWHRGTPDIFQKQNIQRYCLSDEARQAKAEALACHTSQLDHASGEPILPENLLWPARLPFEVFIQV
jgi:LmbE family N-acetylglucosaminyl deacetylase